MKGMIFIRSVSTVQTSVIPFSVIKGTAAVDIQNEEGYNTIRNDSACLRREVNHMASPIEVKVSLWNNGGIWTARGSYYDPDTHERKRLSKSLELKVADNTKRKAQKLLPEVKSEWEHSLNSTAINENCSFEEYVRRWLKERSASIKDNTRQNYTYSAERYIIPMLGNISICDISYNDLQQYCDTLAETLSVDTIKKHFAVINGTIKDAIRKGIINSNPANLVQMPRKKTKFHGKALTAEQAKALLKAAEKAGEPIHAIVVLAMVYGLRRSEICGLRWQDIDLDSKTLHICNTYVRTRGECLEEERTKTERSDRVIALMDFTVPYLQTLKDSQSTAGVKLDKVCCWKDGSNVSPEYVTRIIPKLSESCGLPRVGAHDMRRTAASLLIANGATPQQAQEFLGHEDIATTMNIYTRCFNETKKQTSELMNKIYIS